MGGITTSQLSLGLATVACALVLLSALVEARVARAGPVFTVLLGLVALGACYAYPNMGEGRHSGGWVHSHEQFHFFFGSKYLEEVRYDGLYLAALAAEEERLGEVPDWEIRDTSTFRVEKAAQVIDQAHAVRARFSEERWKAYVADLDAFSSSLKARLKRYVVDHGNTGSPSWAAVALPFTASQVPSRASATFLAALDPILLGVLLITTWRCLGARAAFMVAILGLLPVRAWDYLGGSILRVDWLFALGMSANMLGVKRYRSAGLFLGYAVGSKVFCGLIALALGIRFLVEAVRRRRFAPEHLRLVGWSVLGLLLSAAVSALLFGGFDIWRDYVLRILESLHEGYYRSQHSFRDLYLQLYHSPQTALLEPVPEKIWAGVRKVSIDNHPWAFLLARLGVLGALSFVIARNDEMFAWWVGVLFIFVVLVTNMYYWQMLLLAGVAAARRGAPARHSLVLAGAVGLVIAGRAAEQMDIPMGNQGYFGSFWLMWTCIGLVGLELGTWAWGRWGRGA